MLLDSSALRTEEDSSAEALTVAGGGGAPVEAPIINDDEETGDGGAPAEAHILIDDEVDEDNISFDLDIKECLDRNFISKDINFRGGGISVNSIVRNLKPGGKLHDHLYNMSESYNLIHIGVGVYGVKWNSDGTTTKDKFGFQGFLSQEFV